MTSNLSRRKFIGASLAVSAGGILPANAASSAQNTAKPAAPAGIKIRESMPKGKIEGLEISRLILGSNLITSVMHSRDLQYVNSLSSHYNTDDKILETFRLGEEYGLDTIITYAEPRIMTLLKKHRFELGGKLKWIINLNGQLDKDLKAFSENAKKAADDGADGLYLLGSHADKLAAYGKIEMIAKTVEIMKEQNLPAGIAAHDLKVISICEEHKIPADFYLKTFHHLNYPSAPKEPKLSHPTMEIPGYWCSNPGETIEVFKKVEKPWIAFKVMAAGAILPEDGFRYAFENGADHILAGILDFQVAEDAKITRDILADLKRSRPWRS